MSKKITIALAGNPNSGKTTIFNNITGARQKVGNWPGVTVEKKEGAVRHNGYKLTVVDLPGTYSLSPYSIEELVARNFIVDQSPDVVIDVIDAANLERNLYLATQLIEMGVPLVLALNMSDVARSRGYRMDGARLGRMLGVPLVFTVGTRNEGTNDLLRQAIEVAEERSPTRRHIHIGYGREIEEEIHAIQQVLRKQADSGIPYSTRWLSVKLLEGDEEIDRRLRLEEIGGPELEAQTEKSRTHISSLFDEAPEVIISDQRYGFISGALREVLQYPPADRRYLSDQVDTVLTNRFLGLPLFIFLVWAMFQLTFNVGALPMGWIEHGVGWLGEALASRMGEGILRDLLVDGVIGGVGGVIVFLPNIFILFFCIALFEDTGYMARAAFLMDKVMHTLRLHGKSFIPMIMGFGCNAPAIMATRTLESERDRLLTMLINPLVSCSARLPVYILIAGTFFAERAGTVIFSIYLIGIVLAILVGQVLARTLFRGEVAPFVMELPPYRMPTLKGTLIHMWERGSIFIKKMGTVILAGSVIIWFLSSFPAGSRSVDETYLGRTGRAIAPVFEPLGLSWRDSVAILTGFVAKEIVVSTYGVLYQVGDEEGAENESLREALRASGMTPLVAFAIMVFVLTYTPCLATLAAIRRESGSWRWTAFSIGYQTVLAWTLAFSIVQGGRLIGLG